MLEISRQGAKILISTKLPGGYTAVVNEFDLLQSQLLIHIIQSLVGDPNSTRYGVSTGPESIC